MAVVVYQTDVFDFDMDIVIHQANVRKIMGAGIARTVKNKYREAYIADLKFEIPVGEERLGKFSWSWVDNNKFRIFNLYGQDLYGEGPEGDGVLTDYDNLELALRGVMKLLSKEENFKELRIGIPYGLGSVLSKGSFPIVRDIFERVSEEYGITIYACKKD
jgi:hypothetical protein